MDVAELKLAKIKSEARRFFVQGSPCTPDNIAHKKKLYFFSPFPITKQILSRKGIASVVQ
ncbi:MAG: hypothetical protein DRR19_11120 [Candidatus Parabeggiatoa sp. nov. 1]|nr:MAG: hypothetical protein DRR19_11120 [Gammaproteobacteria bacterium]